MVASVLAAVLIAVGQWPALDTVASNVATHPVGMSCESPAQWASDPLHAADSDGYALIEQNRAVLSPMACGYAVLLVADPSGVFAHRWIGPEADAREAGALLAVIHESMHLKAGDRDEGRVECAAIRAWPSVAALLGIPPKRLALLQSYAQTAHRRLPPAYHTEC